MGLEDGAETAVANMSQFDRAEVGGYYVIYDDSYTSYSPGAAFESGYTEVPT